MIEQDLADEVLENKIKPFINDYLGQVFEDIIFEYLRKLNREKKLPFVFEKIGKWWGNNPVKKCEEEIDIVAYDRENILFGECKWKREGVGDKDVRELMEKSVLFKFKNKFYAFFSKSGFTDEVVRLSKASGNILLFDLKDLREFE